MERSFLIWGLVLIFGVPILTIVLGEAINRLERQRNPLAPFLRRIRQYLLPALSLFLLMWAILGFTRVQLPLKVVETVYWIVAIYTVFSLLKAVLVSGTKARSWQIQVPNLGFQVARSLVALGILCYVLGGIWSVNLGDVATALGVGSLVIALALQDTLSNLVSGFLLLFSNPFKVGDWIQFGDIEAEVIAQDWIAVRLRTITGHLVSVPNGVLAQDSIYNYTMLHPWTWRDFFVGFSYQDPPNLVKRILLESALATEEVLADPTPLIFVESYEDFYIKYYVGYALKNFADSYDVTDAIKARIYYAARRNKLTIPIPTHQIYRIEGSVYQSDMSPKEIEAFLRSLPYFSSLERTTLDSLAQEAIVSDYGIDDRIVRMGEPDEGFYIILEGSLQLFVMDMYDRKQTVSYLRRGDCFGEMALLPGEPSPVSGTAIEDLKAIVLAPDLVGKLIESSPKFALEMNQFIEERRRMVRLARGVDAALASQPSENGSSANDAIAAPLP